MVNEFNDIVISAIIFYVVGLILLIAGIAVWCGKTGLIHEYHRRNVVDFKNYRKAMGKAICGMGLSAFVCASSFLLGTDWIWWGIGAFTLGFTAMFVILYFVQKKYNGGMFG